MQRHLVPPWRGFAATVLFEPRRGGHGSKRQIISTVAPRFRKSRTTSTGPNCRSYIPEPPNHFDKKLQRRLPQIVGLRTSGLKCVRFWGSGASGLEVFGMRLSPLCVRGF